MSDRSSSFGHRMGCLAYGLAAYVLFLCTFAYAMGFIGNLVVPKSIDTGVPGSFGLAIVVNVALLGLFAAQHTIMARQWFKHRWTRIIPAPIERSTFVVATCFVLILMYWQWRPMPEIVWSLEHPAARWPLHGFFVLGWLLVLYSSFCIDHFDLFGVRQVVLHLRGLDYTHPGFAMPWLYKLVRNPLMLGFLLASWATPVMTQGHLLFAITISGYIVFGITMEERDLLKSLGEDYRRYRKRTPMLFPLPRRRDAKVSATAERATWF
ncbi:MAG: isoprenylcysteine carboxylmethyltransferase family protein [Phycisphaerales bacterium]|nr:MAG: isoprenylcysteine carboxylmethyltransferase family protein [Phycisphaerales bacterium]